MYKRQEANIALDLAYNIYHHPDKNLWTFARVENDSTVVGYRQTTGWARTRTVHFAMRFDRPIDAYGYERGQAMTYNGFYRRFNESENFPEMAGKDLRAWFSFGVFEPGETLGVRVALSGVSTAGALGNLEAETEQPGFDTYRTDAKQTWNEALSIAHIELSLIHI